MRSGRCENPTWSAAGSLWTFSHRALVTLDAYSITDATLTIDGAASADDWVEIGYELRCAACTRRSAGRWRLDYIDDGHPTPIDLRSFGISDCRDGCVVSLHYGAVELRCTQAGGGGQMHIACKATVSDAVLAQVGGLVMRLALVALADTGGTFSDIRGNLIRLGGVEL